MASPLVLPDVLPVPAPFDEAEGVLPPGAPTADGRITELVAIDDERAIVRFVVPGEHWERKWWIALMARDGSLQWLQALSGRLDPSAPGSGIQIVGDAVSVMTTKLQGSEPQLTLHVFALADGARRAKAKIGKGYDVGTAVDGTRRFDVRVHYPMATGAETKVELVASDAQRVLWRAPLSMLPAAGPELTVVGDALVLRTRDGNDDHAQWYVFERHSGTLRGRVPARVQGCSDGERWFVLDDDGLLSVDPKTLRTRRVTGAVELEERSGTWELEDCGVVGGNPVVLVGRGYQKALMAFDGQTHAPLQEVTLGAVIVGPTGFDPMPVRSHGKMVLDLSSREGGGRQMMVVDPVAGRVLERWSSTHDDSLRHWTVWSGGYLVETEHTYAVLDGHTGQLAGRAMVPEDSSVDRQRIVGSTLWLVEGAKHRLGTRAPRLLDLSEVASDDVRGAVLADVRSNPLGVKRRSPCPDPTTHVVGDGLGTDGTLGPVTPTRMPTWDLDILYESARTVVCAPGSAPTRLMAWYVIEDDRPLRNDNALLMVEDTSVKPPRYSLVQFYRHANNREWNMDVSFHSPSEPVRTFDHRPTRQEIDDFMAQSEWLFDHEWGKILAGNVVDAQWRAATHLAPWRSYPKGIEQPD